MGDSVSGIDPVSIHLPGPVRGKGRHRSRIAKARDGRSFIANYADTATRSYEGMLRAAAADAMDGRPPLDGPVLVKILAVFAVPASWSRRKRAEALDGITRPTVKPDGDNIMKCCDALNGIVWRDDAQVVAWTGRKVYGERPGLSVEVVPIVMRPVLAPVGAAPLFGEEKAA